MKRLAVLALPFMCLAGPAMAADLEGPTYSERESYVRPPIVDRKIVEHHHYHHQAPPVYREKRVYVEPRVYEEPVYKGALLPAPLRLRVSRLEASPLLRAAASLGTPRWSPALVKGTTHD